MASTQRDLILDLIHGTSLSRVGLREVNIWPETLCAWMEQGYPVAGGEAAPVDWVTHFGYDMASVGGAFDVCLCAGTGKSSMRATSGP